MKTIFVTISRGFIARNILQTDIYKNLLLQGHRIILASPAWEDVDFFHEFGNKNVEFVPLHIAPWTKRDIFFTGLHKNIIWNKTIRFTAKYGVYDAGDTSFFRYMIHLFVFRPISFFPYIRPLVRLFDKILQPAPANVLKQLSEIKPDLVFLTNPMEITDSQYIKAAKTLGIQTVGLVKSWDNMSKTSFRILPDDCLVWGPYMKEEAVRYQDFSTDRIFEVGVPQFDIYVHRDELASKEKVLQSFGLDEKRKTIVFGSEGKVTPTDPEIVQDILDMIDNQDLSEATQVLVRPHFGYKHDEKKFDSLVERAHFSIDVANTPRPAFYDQWDFSRNHYLRLAETLLIADVLITTASTLAIDAAVFGIPVILIAFDGKKKLSKKMSVARWYETEYYSRVLSTGFGILVKNRSELRTALISVLKNQNRREKERRMLVSSFAGACDGHAGERVSSFLNKFLSSEK